MSDVREVDPWTLSYLVTVEAPRQAEQLRMPSLECAPLGPAAPAAAATEYTEPEVVFRLRGTAAAISDPIYSSRSTRKVATMAFLSS